MVTKPQFGYAFGFSEGLAAVAIDDKAATWGFIDTTGKYVIGADYNITFAGSFVDGLALVVVKSSTKSGAGYIDKTGKFVWGPSN